MDIDQTRLYAKNHFGTYIKSFIERHKCDDTDKKETRLVEPISPNIINKLESNI